MIELGTTVRVQSGFPYSPPIGVRVAAVEDAEDSDGDGNATELVPQRDSVGLLVWTTDFGDSSNLNSGRLPLFAASICGLRSGRAGRTVAGSCMSR